MVDTPDGARRPNWTVTTWDSSARTVRLTLPPQIDADADIAVGAVGAGWLELTDDPEAPRMEITATRQSRNRVALHSVGALMRFGGEYGQVVVVHVTGEPGRHLIRAVAKEHTELRLPRASRPTLMAADGWDPHWQTTVAAEG